MIQKFLLILAALTISLLTGEYLFTQANSLLTANIIMIGTTLLAAITLFTFIISYRASLKASPHQFVNGVMGSTFLKFVLCAIAAGIYIYLERKNINKPDLFFMMFIYILYTTIETMFLFSLSKSNAPRK
jgi:heme/copper-type cytochrome/quinol oxidase subunit 2